MLNQIKRWLEPPCFDGDEEKTTQTRFANTLIIYLGTALLIVIFILIPLFAIQKIGSWILAITIFCVLAVGRHILFKGYYRQGTILIFSVIYLCIFAMLILSGGSSSTAMFYFATVVLIAGFFLEARVVNGLTIATFLIAVGIAFLQDRGLVALPKVFIFNSVFSWIATGVGLLLMIRARELFVGNLKNALALARQENAARQQAEDGLKLSLSLLQAALEATADGILVVNSTGKITQWNRKFAEMWNLHQEILNTQDDAAVMGLILAQLSDPEPFLDKVKYLYAQPAESSVDQIELLDRRIFERYSQPQRNDADIIGRVWSFRDISERKRILESLTESEARYRLLANNVPDIIYSLDGAGNIVTINSLAFERYGYREQDTKGKPFLTFIHPEDREIVIRSFIKAVEEQRQLTHDLQFRIVAENGAIYWFELNSRTHFDHDGRYLGEDGVLRDITARKQTEAALRESQELLSLFVQHSPIYTYIKAVSATEDRLLQASENMRELIGISSDQAMVGKTMEELFPPEFAEKISADDRAVVARGKVLKLDEDLNGRHYTTIKFPLVQAGKTLLAGYTIDITERKEAELALLEAKTLTNAIVDSTSDLIWSVDPENFGLLTFNHGLSDYFLKGRGMHIQIGMRPEELFPPGEFVQKWREFYQRAIREGSFTIEYTTYSGSMTLQLTFNLLKRNGKVYGVSVFGRDITERKLTEEVLRESELHFRAFVEQSPVSIGVFNLEGNGLYANRKFMEVLGLKSDKEVVGRPAYEFFTHQFREQSKERTQRRLQGLPVPAVYESTCLRSDGTEFPVNLAVAPIQLPGGTASIAFLTDITESKQAEETLQQQNQILSALQNTTLELVSQLDLKILLENIVKRACALVGTSAGLLDLIDPATNQLIPQVGVGALEESLHLPVLPGEGLTGIVWQTGAMLVIPDYDQWVGRLGGFSRGTLGSVIGMPLLSGTQVLGVLVTGSAYGSPHHFDSDAIEILNQFARLATVAVQNARLFSNLQAELSERKQAEYLLRESKDQMEMAQTMGHTGSWVYNLETGKIWGTVEAYRIFGFAADAGDFLLEDIEACIPERERAHQALVALISEGQTYDLEYAVNPADGAPSRITHSIARLEKDAQGNPLKVSGFIQDITELKRAEEDRIAREIAEQANRAKSEFISRMSHELRTPLNAILGFSQLLKMDELKPNQTRGVDQIYKSGRHLLNLVNEVLDIARIESGKMQISPEPVRLADMLQEALELIRPMAETRHISITGTQSGGSLLRFVWGSSTILETQVLSNIWVQADPQSLRQVLLNLLSNAVKYNRVGGEIAITVSLTIDGQARLQVCDTGEGIPPEKMERLFTPFDRLDRDSIEQEGTGLGLALSKGLVEAMGGRIGAQSKLGEGSIFWLELKLVSERLTEAILTEVDAHLSERTRSSCGLVLYVEDNLDNIKLVEAIMERLPWVKLMTAMQGRLALELAQEHHPDLILLDLHLPDMHGSEVLRRLKAESATQKTPVIILSADAMLEHIDDLLVGGARAYLTKPIDIQKFLKVVEETLEK